MIRKLDDLLSTLKKIDIIGSRAYLYYAATGGFLFGWISLAVFLMSISGEMPLLYVLSLRIFYFLISFLFGLKLLIYVLDYLKKKSRY